MWTTFPKPNGGTIRIGVPEYVLLRGKQRPQEIGALTNEATSGIKQERFCLAEGVIIDGGNIFPVRAREINEILGRTSESVDRTMQTLTIQEFGSIIQGLRQLKNIQESFNALDEQKAFGIARYNQMNRPIFWSQGMEKTIGYNLQQLQYYLDDWKAFFFGSENKQNIEHIIENAVYSYTEEDDGMDIENAEIIPTVFPFKMSLREFRIHEAAEKSGRASLMNLFYAYSQEKLDNVNSFTSQLKPMEGYSEALFEPRQSNGFPIRTKWTSIGDSIGSIRFMREEAPRSDDERSFDRNPSDGII